MPHILATIEAVTEATADGPVGWALLAAIITVIVGAVGVLRWLLPRIKKFDLLVDDFLGTPARPGVAARPGVMERLQQNDLDHAALLEKAAANADGVAANALATAAVSSQLAVIVDSVGQLQSNGGSTMRDQLARIEHDTALSVGRIVHADAPLH